MSSIAFKNFHEAGQAVLHFLHQKFGFDLWMITRVEGNDWIVLQSEDHGYDVKPGRVFNWADSFCSHMVLGHAPRIAPRSEDIPLYASAPIAQQVNIKAYIGQPLVKEDGSLFGTLCAIDPEPKSEQIIEDGGLVELFGNLLSHILQREIRENEQIRLHERLQNEAVIDAMTGVYNRRGWNQFLCTEEERCKIYGHPAAVLMIDLNGLKAINDQQGHAEGDRFIEQAAFILRKSLRQEDLLARLGGDEFGILILGHDHDNLEHLKQRLLEHLADAKISAAIGYAMRHPSHGLEDACKYADEQMYIHKRECKMH
ncbi:sensor domain-containing diguanylate cyclase [Acinetobacter guerrae]|uniref:diguanylate cyclase n=1 Tax=Acinetobacter guerrae TaxID=1843371 RepID=A0A3A8ELY7_9GAMM|nr:sensor domain-containing diguanylate cyclase [Acinetobacter guerrae]MPW45037.1 histidine kinase [Acinetobacter guerrae]RKG35625.1 sensor domain-containing diguanylate cyclase [Acinetobacter guerrae]